MSGTTAIRLLGCGALGVVVGLVGTGVHRWSPPMGLVLAYVAVASAAVLVRAWVGAGGMAVLALAVLGTVLAMAFVRPGGDVIVADGSIGYAWLAGAGVVVLAGLLPRRMFSDRPFGGGDGGRP